MPCYFLDFRGDASKTELMNSPHLERAIGVVYRPETERVSHYFLADMRRQFDAVFHFDETRALQPLEKPERWHEIEPPETFPSGI
jgi:erythromycin esterase-like protein